jgi:hypothetical protein
VGGDSLGSRAIVADTKEIHQLNKCLSAALAATLVMATGACQQPTGPQLNATNANSQVYIGALTCNVSGGTGYIFGSTKDLSCVYLTKATTWRP